MTLKKSQSSGPEADTLILGLGLGFPPFRGGPFRYIDALGAAEIVRLMEKWQTDHGDRFRPAELLMDYARNDGKFFSKGE